MGCLKLTYQKNNPVCLQTDKLEVNKNYFKKELTSKKSLDKGYSKYLFGSKMPGRSFVSENKYRFGFQGQEEDEETGLVNYKYRMHDPRLGRFFTTDPLMAKFAYNSPYAFSENRVIDGIELEGLEVWLLGNNTNFSFGISFGNEGGVVLAPDGVFKYYSEYGGANVNLSVSSSISITYFHNMPSAKDLRGEGRQYGVGVSYMGKGLSISYVESGGYSGVNVSIPYVSADLIPASIFAYKSNTEISPLDNTSNNTFLREGLSLMVSNMDENIASLKSEVSTLGKMQDVYINNMNNSETQENAQMWQNKVWETGDEMSKIWDNINMIEEEKCNLTEAITKLD